MVRRFSCGETVLIVTKMGAATAADLCKYLGTRTGKPASVVFYVTPDGRVARVSYETARMARTAEKNPRPDKGVTLKIDKCKGTQNCPLCRINSGGDDVSEEKAPNGNGNGNNNSPRSNNGNNGSPTRGNNRSPRSNRRN